MEHFDLFSQNGLRIDLSRSNQIDFYIYFAKSVAVISYDKDYDGYSVEILNLTRSKFPLSKVRVGWSVMWYE